MLMGDKNQEFAHFLIAMCCVVGFGAVFWAKQEWNWD